MRSARSYLPLIALAALAVVSCDTRLPTASRRAAPGTPPDVVIDTPLVNTQVNVGDSIVWTNKDPFPHTVTANGGAFDSKQLAAAKTWTYRAQKKGDYPYVCTLHPTMSGTIHVK